MKPTIYTWASARPRAAAPTKMCFSYKTILIIFLFLALSAGALWVKADSSPAASFSETLFGRVGSIIKEFSALAQETAPSEAYFFPNYPQRLMYIISELSLASQELVSLNQELKSSTDKCSCGNTTSQCQGGGAFCRSGPMGAFGDPCSNREEIRNWQSEIVDKNDQITYLRNLLQKEMETGLQGELDTLRPEVAADLKSNLEKILGESQNILPPSQNNINLPQNCTADSCSANCNLGMIFSLKFCLMIGTGAQKAIELKFKAGVKLDDLKLGRIGIKNVDLSLPDEIELPKIGDLSVTIPSQEISFSFPQLTMANIQSQGIDLSSQSFTLAPQLSLPEPPAIGLACPKFPSFPSYQCTESNEDPEFDAIEYQWYFQTINYLSQKCQELPIMKEKNGPSASSSACFDPTSLPTTLSRECNGVWTNYCLPGGTAEAPPQICKDMKYSCTQDGQIAAAIQCQKLFAQEKEALPAACKYGTDPYGTISLPTGFDPVNALKNKCNTLKKGGRKDPPEPCEILPVFTGTIDVPDAYNRNIKEGSCPAQVIGNQPNSMLSCPYSGPTIPKITFPKIIIPDIIMPYFSLFPFLEVKLPSFYFEDLVLPDIDLCNLNECSGVFPNLSFNFPSLNLPQMNPSLRLPDLNTNFHGFPLKIPMPEIKANIQFPAIVLGMPNLYQFNLANLMTPELELPQIQMPQPQFYFSFAGIDLAAIFELIITIILNKLDVPDISVCYGIGTTALPLRIIFPDYYFYWPAFPQIPEIPFCKDIQSFCRVLKTGLKSITDKVDQMQNLMNGILSKEVQAKLNQLAQLANKEMTGRINEIMQTYSQMLQSEVQKALGLATVDSNGIIKIPPVYLWLPEKKITIPLSKMVPLPDKITIPWPPELKRIAVAGSLGYDLPDIPLSKLSYEKEVTIKGPGFQPRTITIDLGVLGNRGECLSGTPSGGNPCPQGELQKNIDSIKSVQQQIGETSQKIINILE